MTFNKEQKQKWFTLHYLSIGYKEVEQDNGLYLTLQKDFKNITVKLYFGTNYTFSISIYDKIDNYRLQSKQFDFNDKKLDIVVLIKELDIFINTAVKYFTVEEGE